MFHFSVFSKIQPRHLCNYNYPPRHQIMIIIFRRATIIITIMAAGLQKDEFYSYIGRLRHGPNSIKNNIFGAPWGPMGPLWPRPARRRNLPGCILSVLVLFDLTAFLETFCLLCFFLKICCYLILQDRIFDIYFVPQYYLLLL